MHIQPPLPDAAQAQLALLSKQLDQSPEWVLAQAIDHFARLQSWQSEQIHLALREADAGDFASPEAIDALNRKYAPQ